jgi:hypothetical protein
MDDRSYSVFLQSVVEIKNTLGSVDPAILSETSLRRRYRGKESYYGFLSNRHRKDKLAVCRRLLGMPALDPQTAPAAEGSL